MCTWADIFIVNSGVHEAYAHVYHLVYNKYVQLATCDS